jgi:ferric-dicitrate binding protein FerR (iron transport regulator)
MPYKDPERKRQWEEEHREQRNARRRTHRLDAGSGQPSVPKVTSDIAAALHTQVRKRAPDPVSDEESQGTWIAALLGLAVAIGAVLLAAVASFSSLTPSASSGSGKSPA